MALRKWFYQEELRSGWSTDDMYSIDIYCLNCSACNFLYIRKGIRFSKIGNEIICKNCGCAVYHRDDVICEGFKKVERL
jgi:hypothetical protein